MVRISTSSGARRRPGRSGSRCTNRLINGVGFGKTATFRFDGTLETINQDPHDSFLYLLAGGGDPHSVGLPPAPAHLCRRRSRASLRRATDPYQRLIVLWSMAMLFMFLVNAAASPVLSDPSNAVDHLGRHASPVVDPTRGRARGLRVCAHRLLCREPRNAFSRPTPNLRQSERQRAPRPLPDR